MNWSWIFLLVTAAGPAWADERRAMTPLDLLEVPRLSDPRLAPDARQLLYVLAETDWEANEKVSHVWRIDLGEDGEKEPIQMTSGAALSPDGSTVLFVTGSNEKFETYYNNNLFLVPAEGGPHRLLLADMPYGMGPASWSEDGQSIYFVANMGVRSGCGCGELDLDVRPERREDLSHALVRRHSLGGECPDRDLLDPFTAFGDLQSEDPDARAGGGK